MKEGAAKNLAGSCGLYCGLCSKYQSKAPSRCVGCRSGEQHSWCSIWNCCTKKHGFETCAGCASDFDCPIFLRRRVAEWTPAVHNLRQIRKSGLEGFLREQEARQVLLERLLQDYNEGRSMSLYCRACARMPVDLIGKAIEETEKIIAAENTAGSGVKSRAGILKSVINGLAREAGIDLK